MVENYYMDAKDIEYYSTGTEQRPVIGFCEHDNGSLSSVKWVFLDWLKRLGTCNEYSTQQNWFVL